MPTVKVLFSLGDWEICYREDYSIKYFATYTKCPTGSTYGWLCWGIDDFYPKCFGCGTSVPDEIQGILQMLTWDYKRRT